MHILRKITITTLILITMTACTTLPPATQDHEKPAEVEASNRLKNTMLAIGGIIVLSAIIVHEAEDGVSDAVRQAGRP